ncbi:hypothetical protein ACFFRR_001406 [Megaselia abdita]
MSISRDTNEISEMTPKSDENSPNGQQTNGEDVSDADLQEMEALNDSLDQLSSVLDMMEKRTDDIMAQSLELLKSNRAIREAMAKEKNGQGDNHDLPDPMEQQ